MACTKTGCSVLSVIDSTLQSLTTIDPDIKLSIGLRDGRILDWDTYQQSYDELNPPLYLTRYIRISAWTTPIRLLRRISSLGRVKYEAYVELKNGSYSHWRFSLTTKEPLADQQYTGIHLGWVEPQDVFGPGSPLVWVAGSVGDRTERVGFGSIDDKNYKLYDLDGVYEHADEEEPALSRNRLYIRKPILVKSSQEIRLG